MGPRLQPYAIDKKCFNAGFIIFNYEDRFPEGIKQLSTWVKELDFTQTIVEGFDQFPLL
jgi:NADPH-dependent curcumin reductase CurA